MKQILEKQQTETTKPIVGFLKHKKIDKPLTILIMKKTKKTLITKMRNDCRDITINFKEIKSLLKTMNKIVY